MWGSRIGGPRSERRNSMLPLEKEERKGKERERAKKEEPTFTPPFLSFLFYFPAEANGKCQYLEANGVSGYIWVANTFCSKKEMNPRGVGRVACCRRS